MSGYLRYWDSELLIAWPLNKNIPCEYIRFSTEFLKIAFSFWYNKNNTIFYVGANPIITRNGYLWD